MESHTDINQYFYHIFIEVDELLLIYQYFYHMRD